jgi:hypothetical protein
MALKETLLKYSMKEWPKDLPKPPSFPATLKHFLRLIVNAKTPKGGRDRFRQYLHEEGLPSNYCQPRKPEPIVRPGPDGKPTKYEPMETIVPGNRFGFKRPLTEDERKARANVILQKIETEDEQHGGFFNALEWLAMARHYKNWWSDKKSVKARQSALAKKPKKSP